MVASRFGLYNVYERIELRSNQKRTMMYPSSQAGGPRAAGFKSEDTKSLEQFRYSGKFGDGNKAANSPP